MRFSHLAKSLQNRAGASARLSFPRVLNSSKVFEGKSQRKYSLFGMLGLLNLGRSYEENQ